MELSHTATNIEIRFDPETQILFCNWIGFQNEDLLRKSGLIILNLIKQRSCAKILNDNTQVQGPWYHSADWASSTWFPEMIDAGLKHFAWICSKDIFSQLSAKRAMPKGNVVKIFHTYDEALAWLIKIQ